MRYYALATLLSLLTVSVSADEPQVHFEDASSSNMVYGSMPNPPAVSGDNVPFCILSTDAAVIGRDFGLLISNYTTELAVKLLAEGFIDQADSVNTLINHSPLPYQAVRPPSRAPK